MLRLHRHLLLFSLLTGLLLLHTTALLAKPAITEIPFRLSGSHIFIDVQLNDSDKPLHFIFDTGASSTVISAENAKQLHLSSDGFSSVRSKKGPSIVYYSNRNQLRMGQLTLDRVRLVHLPLDHLTKALEEKVDGIIGHDMLKHYVVQINYDQSTIALYEPGSFVPSYDYQAYPFTLISGRPYIEGALTLHNGETYRGRFQLDNGSGSSITLYSPFVDKHRLSSKIGRTRTIYTMGFTGLVDRNYAGRLKSLDLGWCQLTNIPIRLNQSAYYKKAFKDGIGHIGNELLRRFNIVFDYQNQVSYWKPNQVSAAGFRASYTGLILKTDAERQKVLIRHVFEDSPASKAGFSENDEIVMVDDVRTSGQTTYEVNDLISQEKMVRVVVRRNDQFRTLQFEPMGL